MNDDPNRSRTLSHFDAAGAARMVDVGSKDVTFRYARAAAQVRMRVETGVMIRGGDATKGDVLAVARLAGIMGAKRTGDLIPLCHPLPLEGVTIEFAWPESTVLGISAEAWLHARTGVEMEALTAASVAALTVYDMCKAVDRGMSIERIELCEKRGGKSGPYVRDKFASGEEPTS